MKTYFRADFLTGPGTLGGGGTIAYAQGEAVSDRADHMDDADPVLPPDTYRQCAPWDAGTELARWVGSRVLELTYTSFDLMDFARDLGHAGPPFRWDQKRHPLLRAELDAAFFHLYGVARPDVEYVLGTFAGMAGDEDDGPSDVTGTARLVLEIYDAMQTAIATGRSYQTILDPPPADPRAAHPARADVQSAHREA